MTPSGIRAASGFYATWKVTFQVAFKSGRSREVAQRNFLTWPAKQCDLESDFPGRGCWGRKNFPPLGLSPTGLHPVSFQPQASTHRLPPISFHPKASTHKLPPKGFHPQTSTFHPQASTFHLPPTGFHLPILPYSKVDFVNSEEYQHPSSFLRVCSGIWNSALLRS